MPCYEYKHQMTSNAIKLIHWHDVTILYRKAVCSMQNLTGPLGSQFVSNFLKLPIILLETGLSFWLQLIWCNLTTNPIQLYSTLISHACKRVHLTGPTKIRKIMQIIMHLSLPWFNSIFHSRIIKGRSNEIVSVLWPRKEPRKRFSLSMS